MDWDIEFSIIERILTTIFEMGAVMTRKRKSKSKKVKITNTDPKDNTVDVPSADKPDSDDNLIYVGGNPLYHEEKKHKEYAPKSFKTFREDANLSVLVEKKNRGKKKSKRAGAESLDDRQQKIRDLKKDDSLWKGLE